MRDYLDIEFKAEAVDADGLFSGYASVFNAVDHQKDVVIPGAFRESLGARTPSLLWQHRAGEPIGVYKSVREDAHGLYVEGRLALKTSRGAEAYELLTMGAVTGLSIGFATREDSLDPLSGVRTLKKVDLYEISLVTFPCNDGARIGMVKQLDDIDTVGDAERYLREFGGFSRSQAAGLVARIKAAGKADEPELAGIEALLRKRSASFLGQQRN